jgi:very-short-patch-repair endonuclease
MSRQRISRSKKCGDRSRRPGRPHLFFQQPKDEPLPYERRDALLSRGELAFFRALSQAVAFRHGISMKTRLADVVRCPPELWDTIHGRRLSQKHVDFVVYDRYTAAIIAVVELDDRSHNAKHRRERDAFVDGVLSSLDVAIVRVRAARTYDVENLRLQLDLKRSR